MLWTECLFRLQKAAHSLIIEGAATNIIFVTTNVLSQQICVMTNMCLSQQKFCCNKHTFVATKDVICWDKRMFVTTNTRLSQQNFCWNKKWYLSQLLPMIVLLLTKLMAQTRDKWWHRPELVDLSFKICGVSNVDKETQECMISILSIVLQETGKTVVNFNLYTNQKSWLPLNISIILSLFYVPLQSRFWNDTIDLFFKNCEVSNMGKETQERKYSGRYQYWVLYFKKLARQWWILTSIPIRSPDYLNYINYPVTVLCSTAK